MPSETRHLEYRIEKGNEAALVRTEADGSIWGWQYEAETGQESPEVWVVRDTSTGAVLYAHESEHRTGGISICGQQIGRSGGVQSIIPAGSEIIRLLIPMDDVIIGIETAVHAAPLPAWISGTNWEWVDDIETLLVFLFQAQTQARGMRSYTSIGLAYRSEMPVETSLLYTLLWLRCASSILYDHADQETCIPLGRDRFSVDSGGIVTLVT